jgi:murein DD-endopeptidase MepM/ murein hydrolase activator NlpD
MMLAMMAGLGSNSSDNSSGLNLSSLMLPLMMNLLEKMQSQQSIGVTNDISQQTNMLLNAQLDTTASAEPSGRPVSGRLTQGYHASHHGLDFGIPVGTSIKSTMDGKVIYAGWNNQGYGNLVIVENGPYRTYYAHLSDVPVNVGDVVRKGQTVGISGNTGNSTGPHLHYEIRKNGVAINPTDITLNSSNSSLA